MTDKQWLIDKKSSTIKHTSNGLTLTIEHGEVTNIENVPSSIKSRDLPVLMDDALRAYKNHRTPEPVQHQKPKRLTLSLKK